MKSHEYLDLLKSKKGWTDYRIAKELKINPSAVYVHRNGTAKGFSDEVALKIATHLDMDPLKVIADMHAARATKQTVKAFWKKLGSAAVVVLALFILQPENVHAEKAVNVENDLTTYRLCAVKGGCGSGLAVTFQDEK